MHRKRTISVRALRDSLSPVRVIESRLSAPGRWTAPASRGTGRSERPSPGHRPRWLELWPQPQEFAHTGEVYRQCDRQGLAFDLRCAEVAGPSETTRDLDERGCVPRWASAPGAPASETSARPPEPRPAASATAALPRRPRSGPECEDLAPRVDACVSGTAVNACRLRKTSRQVGKRFCSSSLFGPIRDVSIAARHRRPPLLAGPRLRIVPSLPCGTQPAAPAGRAS